MGGGGSKARQACNQPSKEAGFSEDIHRSSQPNPTSFATVYSELLQYAVVLHQQPILLHCNMCSFSQDHFTGLYVTGRQV